MHWTEQYIGIPWLLGGRDKSALDCWGLLRLLYRQEYGIELSTYANGTAETITEVLSSGAVDKWHSVETPQEGDAVAIGRGDTFSHVGIYLELERPSLLHAQVNSSSNIITLRQMRRTGWSNLKFYQHDSRL